MYKNKDKQREVNRASAKRYRKGMTEKEAIAGARYVESRYPGLLAEFKGRVGMMTEKGMIPDILDKLTDPVWRDRLTKICDSFENSHNPRYKEMCWLGDTNLSMACDYLECTR